MNISNISAFPFQQQNDLGILYLTTEPVTSFDYYDYYNGSFNITYDCADTSDKSFLNSVYFKATVSLLYLAIFCIALLGNGSVLYIIFVSNQQMKTVTNYFIANLAVGDILMCLFCMLFSFASQFIWRFWPFGGFLCRVVNYSQAVSVLVSAYTLVALSVDRYRAIIRPLRPKLSTVAVNCVICFVWIGALLTALPIILVSRQSYPTEWHEGCQRSICREEWPHPEQAHNYSMALMALQFVVPLLVLVFTYIKIGIAVWAKRPPGEAESLRDRRMAKSKRKMVKMMVAVVAVFTICWLPYNSLFAVAFSDESAIEAWETWWLMPYVWFACHWLAMSHCCYNPIIYCYMNAKFRDGYLEILKKIPPFRRYAESKLSQGKPSNQIQMLDRAHNMTGDRITSERIVFRINTRSTFISVKGGCVDPSSSSKCAFTLTSPEMNEGPICSQITSRRVRIVDD